MQLGTADERKCESKVLDQLLVKLHVWRD